jgi:hypothetical protein
MIKTPHINRLVELGLWSKECAQLAELLGKEQLELMLRGRDAIRRFENMSRNPLTMRETAPLLRKALKRAEASRREAKKTNEGQQEEANRRKRIADRIITSLIKERPHLRLPRKQTELANDVRARWPKHETAPAISTLRHWLAEMRPKK